MGSKNWSFIKIANSVKKWNIIIENSNRKYIKWLESKIIKRAFTFREWCEQR